MSKFQTDIIENACECPFYVKSGETRKCFIKSMIPVNIATAVVEGPNSFNESNWDKDCKGLLGYCHVIPLLYNMDAEVPISPEDSAINDFSPFSNSDEIEADNEEDYEDEDEIDVEVGISENNPYLVEYDVLVYPTNEALLIDDDELNQRSGGSVQDECEYKYKDIVVKMGQIYPTSNGSSKKFKSGIKSKTIYHAVVASASRLVSPEAIKKTVYNALYLANSQKLESIAFIPADCGTFPLDESALNQLTSISAYLQTVDREKLYLKRIHIIMQDKESLRAYNEYFERIF